MIITVNCKIWNEDENSKNQVLPPLKGPLLEHTEIDETSKDRKFAKNVRQLR